MATLSGRVSSKLAMPAGRGESEGVGCRGDVGCSASREALPLNFADAFLNIVPSRVGAAGWAGTSVGGRAGTAGTGGAGASDFWRAFVEEVLLRNEKLFPRDLEPCLSLALRDTPAPTLALCDADLFMRLNVAFLGLEGSSNCRALLPEFCASSYGGIGGGGIGGGGRWEKE